MPDDEPKAAASAQAGTATRRTAGAKTVDAAPASESESRTAARQANLERREKAAEAETAQLEAEGRMPENAAITNPAPAGAADMNAGGSFTEPEIKAAIPVDHESIENNPRQGTSAGSNGMDMNDANRRHPSDPNFAGQGIDRSVYGDGPLPGESPASK